MLCRREPIYGHGHGLALRGVGREELVQFECKAVAVAPVDLAAVDIERDSADAEKPYKTANLATLEDWISG